MSYHQAISDIREWWLTSGVAEIKSAQGTYGQHQNIVDTIESFNKPKSKGNIFQRLAKQWRKINEMPDLRSKRAQLQRQLTRQEFALQKRAITDADKLLEIAAEQDPALNHQLNKLHEKREPLLAKRDTFSEMLGRAQSLSLYVKGTMREISEAIDWELMDMASSGAAIISREETAEAKEYMEALSKKLEEFGDYMRAVHSLYPSLQFDSKHFEGLGQGEMVGIFGELLDLDFISAFTSYINREKLLDAEEELEKVQKNISAILIKAGEHYNAAEAEDMVVEAEYLDLRASVARAANLPAHFYAFLPQKPQKGIYQPLADISNVQPE